MHSDGRCMPGAAGLDLTADRAGNTTGAVYSTCGVLTLMAIVGGRAATLGHGDHIRAVRHHRAPSAQAVRQLAHDLRAHEPLGQSRRPRPHVRGTAACASRAHQGRGVSLDSTSIKVHPDGTGALKKTALNPSASPEADGTPRFIWLPRMLERQERSRCRRARRTMRPRAGRC